MTATIVHKPAERLWAYALYGAVLSGAGLPIYIYAPKFYADTYGVSLAALGTVLFVLRLVDVVQDPAFGWLSARLGGLRPQAMGVGAFALALGMIALFALTPPTGALLWFALAATLLFSAFSFLSISFYGQGVSKGSGADGGHVRVAAWRETGALLGVCAAAMAPTLLLGVTDAPFAAFAVGFAGVAFLAALAMAPEWSRERREVAPESLFAVLGEPGARRLLLLALVNATPLAVSSTLFLFFVESRLEAPGWEGPLLVAFFLSAAASAPVWARLAQSYGARPVLLAAMVLAIAAFGGVLTLGPGDIGLFLVICIASGTTIGADLTLLPALFSQRIAATGRDPAQAFGLWAFANKFTLALAAVALLPVLESAGFKSGEPNTEATLWLLTLLYAAVPCVLKLLAIALLATIDLEDD